MPFESSSIISFINKGIINEIALETIDNTNPE